MTASVKTLPQKRSHSEVTNQGLRLQHMKCRGHPTQPITLTFTKVSLSLPSARSVQPSPGSLGSRLCVLWPQPHKCIEKKTGELDVAPAPISLWPSIILSPQEMMLWLSGSPEVKGVRDAHITSGSVSPTPFTRLLVLPPGLSHHSMQAHPSLPLLMFLQLLSPLSLPQEQNSFKISFNSCLL